jgi:hypothetical protein
MHETCAFVNFCVYVDCTYKAAALRLFLWLYSTVTVREIVISGGVMRYDPELFVCGHCGVYVFLYVHVY